MAERLEKSRASLHELLLSIVSCFIILFLFDIVRRLLVLVKEGNLIRLTISPNSKTFEKSMRVCS